MRFNATLTFAIVALACAGVFAFSLNTDANNADNTNPPVHTLSPGQLQEWVTLKGEIQAHSVITVASRNNREAVLIELVAEGTGVSKGDVLARLDSRDLERQLHSLKREVQLAKNTILELTQATQPLQIAELQVAIAETNSALATKAAYLRDSELLARDNLITDLEVNRTRDEINLLQAKHNALLERLAITRDHLQPARLEAANTKLASAIHELAETTADIDQSQILAPGNGVVWYKPLPVGGDFRNARVGDSIYPNQPFLIIPDMSKMVVQLLAPETDIGKITKGSAVIVKPMAYPAMTLRGAVSRVGRVTQQKPGHPVWQRFFPVTVEISNAPPELLPGLSVTSHLLSYHSDDSLLLPRSAVEWRDNLPYVRLVGKKGRIIETPVTLGHADDLHFEVTSGLEPGSRVVL